MKKKILIGTLLIGVFLSSCTTINTPAQKQPDNQTSALRFEAAEYDFGRIKQSGGVVSHDFAFTYTGDAPLNITGTPGSCLCTKGTTDVTSLLKGTTGKLTVEFDPNLHAEPEGKFFKTVAILTDPPLLETPEVKIWVEIDLDLGEEFFTIKNPVSEAPVSQEISEDMRMKAHENSDDHDDGHANGALPTIEEIGNNGQVPALTNSPKKSFVLEAHEVIAKLSDGLTYEYWTFNGTVPGPFLRVREGDEVTVELQNHNGHSNQHSIDLHAVNGPGGGGDATQAYPGQTKSFTFIAKNPGIYVYHCATPSVPEHVASGMYGMILVEPKEGLAPVDREFYLMQGEVYPTLARGSEGHTRFSGEKMLLENPEYIVFNGRVGSVQDSRSFKATVGEKVRIFVGNAGISKISSFHIIGEIFDTVYPEGGTPVQHNIQTTLIPAGGATIVEFIVDEPGTYKIVDHALSRVPKGAYAELVVTEEPQ